MTTTGDTVVYERIPALPTTHYEFELRMPVVCVCHDSCWVVKFGEPEFDEDELNCRGIFDLSGSRDAASPAPPMIYGFGEPGEPLAAVIKVFAEAICATWCGALRAESELPSLKITYDDHHETVDDLPPYPDAKPLTIDDELPREEQFDADEAAEIWTGDEVRGALALLRIVQKATLSGRASEAHHKCCRYRYRDLTSRWHRPHTIERKTIEFIAQRLERCKGSIFW